MHIDSRIRFISLILIIVLGLIANLTPGEIYSLAAFFS